MGFKPAVSLTEQIADHLSSEIIRGRLAPTERIQELKIAKDLGVSRGSVREALLILEGRHLIDIVPRRGAMVSALDADGVEGLLELAADLVTLLFQRVAQRTADAENGTMKPLSSSVERLARSLDEDDDSFVNAKFEFVEAAYPLAENPYLSDVLEHLLPAVHRVAQRASAHPSYDRRDTLRLAKGLLGAIRDQQPERIEDLVHGHFRRERQLASDATLPSDASLH
jgi:DNA-binding GntR family transcriptional regulator